MSNIYLRLEFPKTLSLNSLFDKTFEEVII
jgi:hypothetical protein